eukprot:TRINITY_DN35740_c0_g1_i1.p1 TRINITY_DN35740_c0_g1~~TRINITY_DN35740_c0_g1_i1.p1  ORF type:complete len:426 (+),score=39.64 TRINITY_DN35740_c0_g1_i1:115-1392(+)
MFALLQSLVYIALFGTAAAQESTELCNSSRRNLTSCDNAVDIALGDDRIDGEKPNQCRVGCMHFSHPQIGMRIRSANCSFDLCDVKQPFRTFEISGRMCQPRSLCVAACGNEPPGCVYSGTCRELVCFHEKNTGRAADFRRVTFSGPRTIVRVNDSETSDQGSRLAPFEAVLESKDSCSGQRYSLHNSLCDESSDTFLSDGRKEKGDILTQCRTVCRNLQNEDVEIVRMRTYCGACRSFANSSLCIPQSECQEKCDTPFSEGCVFTGSCKSLVCVSGIDSKLPAVLNSTDESGEHGTIVAVNNEELPTTLDPPIFVKFLESKQVPNASLSVSDSSFSDEEDISTEQPSPSGKDPDAISAITDFTSASVNSSAGQQSTAKEEQSSKWVWLGPTVGLLGTVLTALAALGAAYITRRGGGRHFSESKK